MPPGSYEIPPYAIDDDESEAVRDRKGKGVAGRLPSSSSGQAGGVVKTRKPRVAVNYIRSIEICGYWLQPLEEQSDEYYLPVGDDTREHRPFLEALEALLWSVRGLEGFTWVISRHDWQN